MAKLASWRKGIIHIEMDVDTVYTYLETLATHTISPLLFFPSTAIEVLENITRGIAQYFHLALPNDLNEDIRRRKCTSSAADKLIKWLNIFISIMGASLALDLLKDKFECLLQKRSDF